jgi:hypothetical protein
LRGSQTHIIIDVLNDIIVVLLSTLNIMKQEKSNIKYDRI